MYLPHDTCLGVNYVIRAVSTPGDNGSTTDLTPDGLGVKVYSTESTTEQYIDIPWSFVSENPGSYVITIFQSSGKAMYTLTVRLPAHGSSSSSKQCHPHQPGCWQQLGNTAAAAAAAARKRWSLSAAFTCCLNLAAITLIIMSSASWFWQLSCSAPHSRQQPLLSSSLLLAITPRPWAQLRHTLLPDWDCSGTHCCLTGTAAAFIAESSFTQSVLHQVLH